jgi:tRNA (cytidine32/uridine32-2'-O)-methyltransferase
MLNNIRIVMIETWHPGNIGSAARAMKTMGLKNLYLVNPVDYPHAEATSLAAGATDVLEGAILCDSFEEAIADCTLVIGTSARRRGMDIPELNPESMAIQTTQESQKNQVAIVFGRERSGLTNDEILKCQFHVNIKANPDYSILNIAQAIQIMCYEILKRHQSLETSDSQPVEIEDIYPEQIALQQLMQHFEDTLKDTGFLNGARDAAVMQKLNRLFARARLEKSEISILRGVLSSMDIKLKDMNK